MGWLSEKIESIKVFFIETGLEMKRTNWPAWDELWQSTVVVIIVVFMLALFIGFSDRVIVILWDLLLKLSHGF